jgi:hypothetical protein
VVVGKRWWWGGDGWKRNCVPTKNNTLVQVSKLLKPTSFTYGVRPSITWQYVGVILSEKKIWENKTCESVKWVKDENWNLWMFRRSSL